jgi:hypothetical protein
LGFGQAEGRETYAKTDKECEPTGGQCHISMDADFQYFGPTLSLSVARGITEEGRGCCTLGQALPVTLREFPLVVFRHIGATR